MSSKYALKRLTRSDLTLFEWHFRNRNAGNQKAINLNADVFVDQLYPTLPQVAASKNGRFPVDLDIYGPSGAPRLNLQRKIVKFGEYKNWRLNGEFIVNPHDQPDRFNVLAEGDFALIEFSGLHYPEAARIALVSAIQDPKLHTECDRAIAGAKMRALTDIDVDSLITASDVAEFFPIAGARLETDLEDAAMGGIEGTRRLIRRSITRPISKQDLLDARRRADEIGVIGEEFVNSFLAGELSAGRIAGFVWESALNAIAPYDFRLELPGGQSTLIDVKATTNRFEGRMHISIAELDQMCNGGAEYRIYRVFEIEGRRAKVRISDPVAQISKSVVDTLSRLPKGISADGVCISPTVMSFGPELTVNLPASDE